MYIYICIYIYKINLKVIYNNVSQCDDIPLIDALFSRSADFINCCLKSDNLTICAVARRGVYFSRSGSPMGIVVWRTYRDISVIKSSLVNCHVRSLVTDTCTFV